MLPTQITVIIFVLFLSYHNSCEGKSHYDTLGVSRGSSGKVITKKYRELAKKLHPDKNKHDPGAQDKFIEVSEAYEVLSNSNSRKEYDHELKFGGSNWSNQHQNQYNRRDNGGFHNFNNEEVFFFRGPDGRIFTGSARSQFPNTKTGQNFEDHFHHEDDFFSSTFEDFFPTYEPKSIFGWISFISITFLFAFVTIMFFLCSFSFSLCAALCDAFPLTALFAGVFLAFLVIFSPSCCNCFRRGKGKVKGKGKDAVKSVRNEPKCTRYERKDESDCGTHTIESSTNLPHFNLKMMTKGRISIICMTENISRICTSLRLKYTQDPFLFSEYVTHDELSSHSNGADITCTGVVKAGGISVIAVYGCGSKWAAFPSNSSVLESDNVDGNIDDISSNNNIKDGNIDLLNNRNQNNDENRLEEERKNASHITADMNTNINTSSSASDSAVRVELDAWLDRILGGICPSVRTVDQPIPYILGINEEIIR